MGKRIRDVTMVYIKEKKNTGTATTRTANSK